MGSIDGDVFLDGLDDGAPVAVVARDGLEGVEQERMVAYYEVATLSDCFVYDLFGDVKTQQCPCSICIPC